MRCSASSPENIAKRSATRRANAAALAEAFYAQTKQCIRPGCGKTFHPTPRPKIDSASWRKRQYCSRACAGPSVMKKPGIAEKHRVNTRACFNDPDFRARHAAAAAKNAVKALRFVDHAKGGRTRTEKAMGFIPLDMRKRYKRLRERMGADAAKQHIREEILEARLARCSHELAASHLRRLGPIVRCNAAGKMDAVGTHWRYGARVMDRASVIRLAVQKGAQIEALTL